MTQFRRIDDAGDLTGKTAIVRVDFNVPITGDRITDITRLKAAKPTVKALTEAGAKVALLAHFGRPKGQRVEAMSLAQIAPAFAAVLGAPVAFAEDCVGESVKAAIAALPAGGVILLENTRFHPAKKRVTKPSRAVWLCLAIYTSMTPFLRPTANMPLRP